MSNPLLDTCELPPFAKIKPEHVKPAVESIIAESEQAVDALLAEKSQAFSWNTLQEPMDTLGDKLNQAWSPVGHMNAVVNTDELRDAYNACLPLLSEYSTRLGQNQDLYQAYLTLSESAEFETLDKAQKKVITDNLRDFKLAGVALPQEKKSPLW